MSACESREIMCLCVPCAHVCGVCPRALCTETFPCTNGSTTVACLKCRNHVQGTPSKATYRVCASGVQRSLVSPRRGGSGVGPRAAGLSRGGHRWAPRARRCTYLQEAGGCRLVVLAQQQIVHEHPEEGLPAAWPGPRVLQDAVELEQVPHWGGGRCVWEVPGEGTRRRGEPEGLGGQGCLREGHSGVAGLALGPHLLPRAGLSPPERLSLKAPGSVWPRAQSPASPNAPH